MSDTAKLQSSATDMAGQFLSSVPIKDCPGCNGTAGVWGCPNHFPNLYVSYQPKLIKAVTVGEVQKWLRDFPPESGCDIGYNKIVVTTPDQAKYIFSNEGDET